MSINAQMVKELRERTNAGFMECKKALQESNGDMETAITQLRKRGIAKAEKKASRVAAEGIVGIMLSTDKHQAVILEVNSETDFAAGNAEFIQFVHNVLDAALNQQISDMKTLTEAKINDASVEQTRQALVAKLGENIALRRMKRIQSKHLLGSYLHGKRIGVVVEMRGGDETLAKDMAMQIAASKPQVVDAKDFPADMITKEKEIFTAQAAESGKPADIIEKMVLGKIKKFVAENSLLGQAYIKDPNQTVAALLKEKQAEVISFTRYEVGEGIDKKSVDFAQEVLAQVQEAK